MIASIIPKTRVKGLNKGQRMGRYGWEWGVKGTRGMGLDDVSRRAKG
jgi:hypothetical protein